MYHEISEGKGKKSTDGILCISVTPRILFSVGLIPFRKFKLGRKLNYSMVQIQLPHPHAWLTHLRYLSTCVCLCIYISMKAQIHVDAYNNNNMQLLLYQRLTFATLSGAISPACLRMSDNSTHHTWDRFDIQCYITTHKTTTMEIYLLIASNKFIFWRTVRYRPRRPTVGTVP